MIWCTYLIGVFTCDNAAPGTTWQKSERNKDRFENIVRRYNNTEHKTELVEELINLLKDKTRYMYSYTCIKE